MWCEANTLSGAQVSPASHPTEDYVIQVSNCHHLATQMAMHGNSVTRFSKLSPIWVSFAFCKWLCMRLNVCECVGRALITVGLWFLYYMPYRLRWEALRIWHTLEANKGIEEFTNSIASKSLNVVAISVCESSHVRLGSCLTPRTQQIHFTSVNTCDNII